MISTLADTFRLAHHSLLELEKCDGLAYHDKYPIAEINQITDTSTNTKVGNRPKTSDNDLQNKTNKNYTFRATAKCVENLDTQQKNVKIT